MNYLITVLGATAIGKTSLSIAIAKHFNCEIISCDSRQFYKEMRIGTAVPSEEELLQVPHHFIQNRSIHDNYNVGQFEKDALALLKKLFKKNKIVVMVGGSGLYVDAVLKGLDYFPDISPNFRIELNQLLENEGLEVLQEQLKRLDPETYNTIDIHNPHRVVRALEICLGSQKKFSSYKNKPKSPRNFTPIKIGLTAPRTTIYKRIDQRVDDMFKKGLFKEAKSLYPYKELNALQTVGYRELFAYFLGDYPFDIAVLDIKQKTRRFAKRQITWFNKDKEIQWFDFKTKAEEIIDVINEIIEA